jgi:hypothetical protein
MRQLYQTSQIVLQERLEFFGRFARHSWQSGYLVDTGCTDGIEGSKGLEQELAPLGPDPSDLF